MKHLRSTIQTTLSRTNHPPCSNRSTLRSPLLWVIILVASLGLAACGGQIAEATPTPTKTPADAETEAPAATTPEPSQTEEEPTAAETSDTPETSTVAVIQADLLNVRSTPSTDGEVVAQVNAGERFPIIGRSQDGEWLQLDDEGRELGWVSAEFVNQEDESAVASDSQATQEPTPSQPRTHLPATMTSPDYGIQAFLWWRTEIADRDLQLMSEANFKWVKQTFAWETIERAGKDQFDWTLADQVVTHVNDAELKLLARLSTDPELTEFWADSPPQNADDFADFAAAVAERYNCTPQAIGCIHAYQIWNEPNLSREWGFNRPNPAEYAEFLAKAYAAIKDANPNAIVISAGMAPTGDENENAMPDDVYYERMYEAMGSSEGYFDMLGVHGAGFAAPPEVAPETAASDPRYGGYRFFTFRRVEDIREIMVRHGDEDKQIVLLEFGWTFDEVNPGYKWHGADAGIDQMVQADYIRRAFEYAEENWQPWIALMSLLTMPNLDWLDMDDPRTEEQYWWAIMEPSPIDQLYFRAAYIELCIYLNALDGQTCVHDPN